MQLGVIAADMNYDFTEFDPQWMCCQVGKND